MKVNHIPTVAPNMYGWDEEEEEEEEREMLLFCFVIICQLVCLKSE